MSETPLPAEPQASSRLDVVMAALSAGLVALTIVARPVMGHDLITADHDPTLWGELALTTLALMALLSLLVGGARALSLRRPAGRLVWLLLVMFLLAAFSPCHALSSYLAVAGAHPWLSALSLFAIGWMLAPRAGILRALLSLAALSGAYAAGLALIQRFSLMDLTRAEYHRMRAQGLLDERFVTASFQRRLASDEVFAHFATSNLLAGYLVLTIPLTTALMLASWARNRPSSASRAARDPLTTGIFALALAAQLFAFSYTGSKAAWGALLLAAPIFSLIIPRWRAALAARRWWLVGAIMVAVLGLGAVMAGFLGDPWARRDDRSLIAEKLLFADSPPDPNTPLAEYSDGLTALGKSWCVRMSYLNTAWRMLDFASPEHDQEWRDHARWLGAGAGAYQLLAGHYQGEGEDYAADPHNGVLRLLIEFGPLFVLALGAVIALSLWLTRLAPSDPARSPSAPLEARRHGDRPVFAAMLGIVALVALGETFVQVGADLAVANDEAWRLALVDAALIALAVLAFALVSRASVISATPASESPDQPSLSGDDEGESPAILRLGLCVGVVAALAHQAFEMTAAVPAITDLAALFLGVLLGLGSQATPWAFTRSWARGRLLWAGVVTAALGAMLVVGAPIARCNLAWERARLHAPDLARVRRQEPEALADAGEQARWYREALVALPAWLPNGALRMENVSRVEQQARPETIEGWPAYRDVALTLIAELRQAAEDRPFSGEYLHRLGMLLSTLNDRRVQSLQPDTLRPDLLVRDYAEVLQVFDRALLLAPQEARVLLERAMIHYLLAVLQVGRRDQEAWEREIRACAEDLRALEHLQRRTFDRDVRDHRFSTAEHEKLIPRLLERCEVIRDHGYRFPVLLTDPDLYQDGSVTVPLDPQYERWGLTPPPSYRPRR